MTRGIQMRSTMGLTKRRGSVYVLVLIAALIVLTVGLSGIAIARINTRKGQNLQDRSEAMSLAGSAVEAALARINTQGPEWRKTYPNNVETTPPFQFGDGTISWKLVDEKDGDLGDDLSDPVRLYGIGRCGNSAWVYGVTLSTTNPLAALNTCIHSAGELEIKGGKSLTVTGAPASTNANFRNDGTLSGDIEALTQSGGGIVTGTVTIPAPAKAFPPSTVFNRYIAKATNLPFSGDIDKCVLTPTLNEYGGGLNPNGIYYINTHGHDIDIKKSRIRGTLIINAGTKRVKVDNEVLLQNYRADCPLLIIRGNLELNYRSDVLLSENGIGHNFNPTDAPYGGLTDGDQDDEYPSEIRGLVHVIGDVNFKNIQTIRGVILCEGAATIENDPTIVHNQAIAKTPPEGYTTSDGDLSISPGSWEREPL